MAPVKITRKRSTIALSVLLAALGGSALGCQPSGPVVPKVEDAGVGKAFLAAFHEEMKAPESPNAYLDAIDAAVKHPGDPNALPTLLASLDAVTYGTGNAPIAHRARENYQTIVVRLRRAWEALDGVDAEAAPFMRVQLASALHGMALFTGEKGGAQVWFARRGCVPAATVIGPLDVSPLTAMEAPAKTPGTGPMPKDYASPGDLNPAKMAEVPAMGCALDPGGASDRPGLRELVIELDNPKDQRLSFTLSSSALTVLEVGGVKLAERRYDAGFGPLMTLAHAKATAGKLRLVLRVADKGDAGSVTLSVVGEDGLPIAARAAKPGDPAEAKISAPTELSFFRAGSKDEDVAANAAALLALSDARHAEHLIERSLLDRREGRDSAVHLLWVRAMRGASDMTDWKQVERTRAAAEEVKKVAPESWEVKGILADLTQRRKGFSDGTYEALAELGVTRPDADMSKLNTMELSLVLQLAQQAGLQDVAERVYAALEKKAPGSPMLASMDASLHPRSGREWLRVACEGGLSRASTQCADAKASVGDRKGALEELTRLRELTSSPRAFRSTEMDLRQKMGDDKGALAVFESMLPWERSTAMVLPLLARSPKKEEAKARALRELAGDRNRAYSAAQVGLAFGEPSPDAKKFETEGRQLVERDKKEAILPGAATAVLRHVEHYGMDADGFMHVVLYDLRRVSGTTDVDRSIYVDQPSVDGRGFMRPLRRRVHKTDGRVLEADAASFSAGGDLSQLEKGDYVEHFLEGYFLPNEVGEYTIDTPDLMPERTSVAEAEVVMRLPEGFKPNMWTHALMGKPVEETKGGYRFLRWTLKNQMARRMEDGLPWLERGVRVSLGTQTWEKVGRAVGETIRGLDDSDPFITRFADEALKSGDAPVSKDDDGAVVARVVEHVGKTIKMASGGGELADFSSFSGGGGHGQSIRSMVEEGIGSRTWITFRTLKELGVEVDLAVAETEPFSAAPNFPPHPGRFQKPLVVAHTDKGDLWIDADVQGPPLPPGRVSPELRGRSAILSGGQIVPVPVSNDERVDEAQIDLVLDAQGTAKGKITLALRSREAQNLAEAFNYVVGEDRKNMLRSVVQGWVSWASVDDVKLVSKEGAWEVTIEAEVTVPGFGSVDGKDGKTWVLPGYDPARSGSLAAMYASKAQRESALNIDSPIQYRVKRSITLPAGAKVDKLAKELKKKSPFFSADRAIKVDGSKIVEEFSLNLPTGTIGTEAYRSFLDEIHAVDSGFQTGVRVRVKD